MDPPPRLLGLDLRRTNVLVPGRGDGKVRMRFRACKSWYVPRWYLFPQPLRWAVGGAIILAGVGATYGIVDSVRDF